MDPKPISKSIDADIVQCKADIMRARQAALAAQKSKGLANPIGSQAGPSVEPVVRPQGPDEGMQALLQMAAEQQDLPKTNGELPARSSTSLPAALRPLEQIRVGTQTPVRPSNSKVFQPLNEVHSDGVLPTSGKMSSAPLNSGAGGGKVTTTPIPTPLADSTPKKLRIPRFEEIVSWGKRILEDRPKAEIAAGTPPSTQIAEIDRLRQELEQVRSIKQTLDSQVIGLQTELTSMTHSLGRARDQLRENANTAEGLYDQIEELQKKIDEQNQQIADLRDQLSKKKAEHEEAVRNLQDSNQIQAQSQEQIQSLQNQLSSRNKEISEFQFKLKQLETTLEQAQAQLQSEMKFRMELQSSTDQTAQLNQRLQETQTAKDQLGQQLADSETAIAEIRSQLDSRQQELTWFRDELKTAQQLADQRQLQIEALGKVSDERNSAQQLAEARQTRIDELQGQQDQLKHRIDELEKEILRLQTDSAAKKDTYDYQCRQIEDMRLESNRLREQIQSQLAAQSAVETELAGARQQIIEGEEIRRNTLEELQRTTGRLESVTKDLQEARSQLDEVKEQWSQSQSRSRTIQEESDRLREELKAARQELESVRLEVADLGSRQHGLEQQLQMESFLAEEIESDNGFPLPEEVPLDVTQLESDMGRQLEPEGRMEWMPLPGKQTPSSLHVSASADDTEIEQVPTQSSIPEFNLAEQILSEQRRISAGRRQRSAESSRSGSRSDGSRGIGHVVQSLSPAVPQRLEPMVSAAAQPVEPVWSQPTEILSSIQREILAEIVSAEIHRFCGRG